MRADGTLTLNGPPQFSGVNTTGAVSASLGSNCPATVSTTPHTWNEVKTAAGLTAYIPCWR